MPSALVAKEVTSAYRQSSRRLLLFDYDGTLTPLVQDAAKALLDADEVSTLRELSVDPCNTIWIVSGRDRAFLEALMESCPRVGLAAEHGAYYRYPSQTQWIDMTQQVDMAWWQPVKTTLVALCQLIPTSHVEEKQAALVWHYRGENELEGEMIRPAIIQLLQHRQQACSWTCRIALGKCIVEVRPDHINKGHVVDTLLEQYSSNTSLMPNFIFCIGDDHTDEDMFAALAASRGQSEKLICARMDPEDTTLADHTLQTPAQLWEILRSWESQCFDAQFS